MSFAALERELGLSNSSIRKWDSSPPSIDKVQKVADYFDVSLDYLIGSEDKTAYTKSELRFLKLYTHAKGSDKDSVKSLMKVIDKLLGEDEE